MALGSKRAALGPDQDSGTVGVFENDCAKRLVTEAQWCSCENESPELQKLQTLGNGEERQSYFKLDCPLVFLWSCH